MAILMIMVIYATFRLKMSPTSVMLSEQPFVIVVDPGHGGDDPGKVGVNQLLEKDINLAISKKLKEMLEDAGYKVVLTRTTDEGLYDAGAGNKKLSDMKKRCSIIENEHADMVISIHQNSFSKESVQGAQVFYYKYSNEGNLLAQCIQKALNEQTDTGNNRMVKDNTTYYMLLHTPCPTVIVECGFLSNPEEANLLGSEEYQEKIANAICEGVRNYYAKEAK